MDCRRTLGLGLCLLIGAVGCTRHDTTVPIVPPAQASKAPAAPSSTAVPVTTVPPGAVVKKLELPKRDPRATCVAAGEFCAKEAAAETDAAARREKQETARKAFDQAISLDPHYLPAYLKLAQFDVAMKDHADAEATYRKAAQLFPTEPSVFFDSGKCYVSEEKWEPAIQAFSRAVDLDPKNRPYVDTLGWVQARAGRFDDSLNTFRHVYDESEAQYRLAQMLDYLGKADLCRQHLQVALKDPKMDKAKALLAKLDAEPAGGVQTAAYVTASKPSAPAVSPAGAAPAARGVVLPPPPRFPIRYEDAPALPSPAPAPDALPALPGPDLNR